MPHSAFLSDSVLQDSLTEEKKLNKFQYSFLLVIKTDYQHFFKKFYSKQIKYKTLIEEVHWSSIICQEGYAIKTTNVLVKFQ